MKQVYIPIALMALSTGRMTAFTPSAFSSGQRRPLTMTQAPFSPSSPLYVSTVAEHDQVIGSVPAATETKSDAPQTEKKMPPANKEPQHKQGIFSPIVLLAKSALGYEKLNKLRAQVISMHSDVISSFVDSADSSVGHAVLKVLFDAADKNHNGKIEEPELADALQALGFEWLKDKQVKGIFTRADSDENGFIELEEWLREAPKTLRTNLIKLAKKNGGELGLLA